MSGPAQDQPRSRLDRLLGTTRQGDYDRRYVIYLLVIAIVGWALASYDFNLLVIALPTISKSLGMSQTQIGLLGFLIYAAMFLISLAVGYSMDRFGRKTCGSSRWSARRSSPGGRSSCTAWTRAVAWELGDSE